MEENNQVTAAWASIGDVSECSARVDALVGAVLGRVLAQCRSVEVASGYVAALAPGVKANCWAIAEEAGHEGPHRMQALLGSYRWDWEQLRGELAGLAAAWLPCDPHDMIGPGAAIDETAQLKHGDATACVAPQHAGITGHVENCVTAVFSAYVTTSGQAWADFDVYMPDRWAKDPERRRAAGIPDDLVMTTKPDLAVAQLGRLIAAGLPVGWAAFDEVYTRSGKLREACEKAGLAYVGIVPCDFSITLASGAMIRADEAVKDAVFERRSCGTGTKGPRFSDWALAGTASPRHFLLVRRLISRPDQLTFYLCYAPEGRPATMTYFIAIAGRRWPVEETFKTGKDVLGWDQSQVRSWDGICRHTALAALAQLRKPPSATPCAASSICRPRQPLRIPAPATPTPTPTLTTLTCAYLSAMRPSLHTPASPARIAAVTSGRRARALRCPHRLPRRHPRHNRAGRRVHRQPPGRRRPRRPGWSSAVGLRGLRAGCATSSVGSGGVRRAMEASDFGYHSVEHSGGRWARPPRMASMVMPSFAA